MDANKFRESVISAIKYMAFFKRHACTFSKPIEVEYGFDGEKRKVIPTICFVEVPDEEIEDDLEKVKFKRGLRSKVGVIDDAKLIAPKDLPTKAAYVSELQTMLPVYDFREWSDPIYQCPEDGCDGGMCKNLTMEFASLPPKYEYRCNKCGHTDYLPQ